MTSINSATSKEHMLHVLRENNACVQGYRWATENCNSLQDIWDSKEYSYIVWLACCEDYLTKDHMHSVFKYALGLIPFDAHYAHELSVLSDVLYDNVFAEASTYYKATDVRYHLLRAAWYACQYLHGEKDAAYGVFEQLSRVVDLFEPVAKYMRTLRVTIS